MNDYVLSRRAREDLREIWNYTADRWDIDQADRYVENRTIGLVAADPERGRPYDRAGRGYRMIASGAHMIFFRKLEDGVFIVRVLHQRMDFLRRL
jgi:toxin ParE1/3/4